VKPMGCAPAICLDGRVRPEHGDAANREPVLLLHGSAGSSALWRHATSALRLLHRCIAPDLIGYGASAPWPADAPFDLDAELRALSPLLPCCDGTFHLVGYSYGGVLALQLALANPARVRTLTLIEPVFFAVLRYAGEWAAYQQFSRLRDEFASTMIKGEREPAMSRFIDFWTGVGAWRNLSAERRADMLKMADKIVLDWQVAFDADPGPGALPVLGNRTMLIRGDRSPQPMCRLVDALHALMPGSSRTVVSGANHLLPLTHAPALTSAILSHLHADAERHLR
jgi:lipase